MEGKRQEKTKRKKHPKERNNKFTHFFFCWQIPIFIKGFNKGFREEDFYTPLEEHDAKSLGDKLESFWLLERNGRKKASLWRALARQFGLELVLYGLMYLPINISFMILKPFLLNQILDYCSGLSVTSEEAYIYGALLSASILFHVLIFSFMSMQMNVVGMKMRIACTSLIYRHVLELKLPEIQQITLGKVINLLSNDVARFDEAFTVSHFIWIGLLQVIIAVVYLNLTLGYSASVGIGIPVLFLILCIFLFKSLSKWRRHVAIATDSRMRLLSDIIFGIRAVKMHTWEEPFTRLIHTARNFEMRQIRLANYLSFGITSSQMYLTPLSWLFSLVVLVLSGLSVTTSYIFTLTNIYRDLMCSMSSFIPASVIALGELRASIGRIEEFLLSGSTNTDRYTPKNSASVKIELRDVELKFKQCSLEILREVTFTASLGQFIGVVGTAGSGKSVLLQLILQEIVPTRGIINVEGSISYAGQDPWIFSGTIRQNILFGEDLDWGRYHKVVRVCALDEDLFSLPHGDDTLVGERGVVLSGGQKARVSLARALYRNADIYLLDDPLSAVDCHVGRHIFEEGILSYLKGKCVLLVTHQEQYLQNADKVYILENSTVKQCEIKLCREFVKDVGSLREISYKTGDLNEQVPENGNRYKTNDVYKRYCTSAGPWRFTVVLIFLLIVTQAFKSSIELFLSFWVDAKILGLDLTQEEFLSGYSIIFISFVLVTLVTFSCFVEYCASCSMKLHQKLFSGIIRAKMAFFVQSSSGQIFNRFSEDMGGIDEVLPRFFLYLSLLILIVAANLLLTSIVNYWMIIPSIILCVVVYLCAIVFHRTNKCLKQVESITRNYIFSHVTATLEGLVTVRTSKKETIFVKEFERYQNLHTTTFYLLRAIYYAFGFWIAVFCVFYTAILVFSFVFLSQKFSVGFVGVTITLTIGLSESFHYLVKNWCIVDTHMISVERIAEYIDVEAEDDDGNFITPGEWPSEGIITFDSVSLRYTPDKPRVLHQVSFHVSPGEKIGIVGRTGAGKTSLISALFRLFDFEGSITIDGIDTKSIPLKCLRSKISIIMQDPVLFVGTLRRNVDPFGQYTDEQIWLALDELDLKSTFAHLPEGLDSEVLEEGTNFSVGQRQLLCLVCIMLRRSKIVVLDEATANVDSETDQVIQRIIRRKFEDCTVLTVAHRLNTIIDSDKVLVLERGRVVEFGHPHELLQNSTGAFYGYVKENGGEVMRVLVERAQSCYNSRIK